MRRMYFDVLNAISDTFSAAWNVTSPILGFVVATFELVALMLAPGGCPLHLHHIIFFI